MLSTDVQVLLHTLKAFEPTNPPVDDTSTTNSTQRQEAPKNARLKYDQVVAQSIYKLPTVWPQGTDFLIDLNQEKSRELFPQEEVCAS